MIVGIRKFAYLFSHKHSPHIVVRLVMVSNERFTTQSMGSYPFLNKFGNSLILLNFKD